MPMVRCKAGLHFYNSDQHSFCPYCRNIGPQPGGGGQKGGGTLPVEQPKTQPHIQTPPIQPPNSATKRPTQEDAGVTKRIVPVDMKDDRVDPVVGWMVCVDGPSRGKDYRIKGGKNNIGRLAKNRIQITGDDTISRENQAFIQYDHKTNQFWMRDGDGSNNNYVNDELLMQPVELKAGNRVLIGETNLIFVPFCGENFKWGEEEEDQS